MKVVIHLGLHRTGTTFLQKEVFPKLKDVNFTRNYTIVTKMERFKINLISNEDLSICPFDNKFHKGLTPTDRFVVIDRIKKIFPHASIILGLRDKEEWSRSLYSQYVKSGYRLSYPEFMMRFNITKFYDFESYVDYIRKNFDNVFVYYLEDLKKDNYKIVSDICSFIGVDVPKYKNKKVNMTMEDNLISRRKYYNVINFGFKKLLKLGMGLK